MSVFLLLKRSKQKPEKHQKRLEIVPQSPSEVDHELLYKEPSAFGSVSNDFERVTGRRKDENGQKEGIPGA